MCSSAPLRVLDSIPCFRTIYWRTFMTIFPIKCTLKRSVVILTQKVLFQHQNKHLLVTVFKHVSAFVALCTMPYWVFKHRNTFLSLKVFVFNHIVSKKASLQSDYSRLKTVHTNYNSHKQSMQVGVWLFLITLMPWKH